METIKNIITDHDKRGISILLPHVSDNVCEEAAELILNNGNKAVILTGFYILSAGAAETDGPIGAIAIGNALALPGGPTVTVGVVSALGRNIDISRDSTLTDLIQTDTVINPGNSGGPLLNLNGDIVGINTVVVRGNANDGTSIEGIGFAVNIDTAALVAKQLINAGKVKWAWMGAYLSDLDPEKAAAYQLSVREGVVIQAIVEEAPAALSELVPGDIIMAINGNKTSSTMELTKMLRHDYAPDDTIELQIFRINPDETTETLQIPLKLGERP